MVETFSTHRDLDKSREELVAELEKVRRELQEARSSVADRLSGGLLAVALDAMPGLVAFVDAERKYRYANATYREWLGVDHDAIAGRPVSDVLGREAYETLLVHLPRVEGGEAVSFPSRLVFRDGRTREMLVKLVPRFSDSGGYLGYFALVLDDTEEKLAGEALRQSEERYRALLDICPAAVYVHHNFEMKFLNPAAARMFGSSDPSELVGRSMLEFLGPSEHELAIRRYEDAVAGANLEPRESTMLRCDGSPFDARTTKERTVWEGEPAVLVVAEDITERKKSEADLEAARRTADDARNRLLDAVENIPEAFAVFSSDERLEFYNSNYAEKIWSHVRDILMPGMKIEEIVRANTRRELGPEYDEAEFEHLVGEAMNRHRNLPMTTELRRIDGRWLRQSKRRTGDGRTVAVYADITETKQREVDLAESEERYRSVVEDSPDAIVVSCAGEIVYANGAAVRLLGAKSKADLEGRNRRELRVPGEEDLPEIRTERSRPATSAAPVEYQKRRRLDGGHVDVDVSAVRILWYGREALLTTMRDVTLRTRTQVALEESEHRLSAAAANFPGAIYQRLMRPDGSVTYPYISRGVRELLGIDAEEIIANPNLLIDIIPGEMRSRVREAMQQSAESMAPYEIEAPAFTRTGDMVWLRSVARPRRLDDGSVIWDGVFLDITERNLARQALQAAKEEAEAANDAKSRFLANVSHELRTPLNAVLGYAEVIRDQIFGPDAGEKYRQYAGDIHASGDHLLSLINDILDLSRIEAGKQVLEETEVPLRKLIEDTVRIADPAIRDNRLKLTIELEPGMPILRVDEIKFRQILLNLLSNACKFTPDGGEIVVSGSVLPDRTIAISIRDSGIGIADTDMAKVLVPFGQVAHARSRNKTGTGLGLPLSKSLVESHGGVFRITSEVGRGTEITIVLPESRGVWQESFAFGGR
ncbi:MAG: PAS domain S-box protein [Rhodospirillaceae bacterium]